MEGFEGAVTPKEVTLQEFIYLCLVLALLVLAVIIDSWNQYKRRHLLAR
jgi:hypothetical protein